MSKKSFLFHFLIRYVKMDKTFLTCSIVNRLFFTRNGYAVDPKIVHNSGTCRSRDIYFQNKKKEERKNGIKKGEGGGHLGLNQRVAYIFYLKYNYISSSKNNCGEINFQRGVNKSMKLVEICHSVGSPCFDRLKVISVENQSQGQIEEEQLDSHTQGRMNE